MRQSDQALPTRDEMVQQLRRVAAREGEQVSLRSYCREAGIPTSWVYRRFAAWGDLREAAGLSRHIDKRQLRAIHTRESLLALLQKVAAEYGEGVTLVEFRRASGLSIPPIERVFGSWWDFREAAGLSRVGKAKPKLRVTRDEVLGLLKHFADSQGPYVTQLEFCAWSGVSQSTVERLGPWTALRKELKLPRQGSRRNAEWAKWNRDMLLGWDEWQEFLELNDLT